MYMPQLRDTFGHWGDIWYEQVDYSRAKSIRDQLVRTGIPRSRVRIIVVV